jgi:predicted phage baseplate assembly protein
MSLPVPNLDDRRFQDIVDEAKRLIPMYCPEWTNHNVSDPGVALIELFAWMTEMTIFRLNQVPDAFYTHMLNLIGFEPFPATAARADLTFWLVGAVPHPVAIPAGTQVGTTGTIGQSRVFTTIEDLTITQPQLIASLTSSAPDVYADVWDDLRIDHAAVTCFPRSPITPGDRFFLGFEGTLAGNAVQLSIRANVEGIGVIPDRPPLAWEVWQGEGWIPTTIVQDTTGGLNRDGVLVMLVPNAHEPLTLGGTRAYWLRATLLAPEAGQPFYRASPQIRSLTVASVGGTVTAEHSLQMGRSILGMSSGRPAQIFRVEQVPVLERNGYEQVILIDSDAGTEQAWTEVPDFLNSGPTDRHVVWDSTTGEIRFGPNIRYPDGSMRQHGAIPPEGTRVAVTGYRYGGGAAGNVGPGTLTSLRSTMPYVATVENLRAATGGVDAETVENAKRRGPQTLRAGARAVTAADYERLAAEADPAIARVRCLPPESPGSPISLLLVPASKVEPHATKLDDLGLTADMVTRVSDYLERRRILGTSIRVGTPYYQGVTVAALIAARPGRPVSLVRERAMNLLYRFINPLVGGPDGRGWPFDTDLNSATLYQLLEAVEGVERVDEVLLFEYDLRNNERVGFAREFVKLERDSLFLSAAHRVVVR